MNEIKFISKKELLAKTGISYGQLYRWKREGVIPEKWFIKKASFTGQETYFPRKQILGRIRVIKKLKSNYSLDELSSILSPDISEKRFLISELSKIEEISSSTFINIKEIYEKSIFSMKEIVAFICISRLQTKYMLDMEQTKIIMNDIKDCISNINGLDYKMAILEFSGQLTAILHSNDTEIIISRKLLIIDEYDLKEVSDTTVLKYREHLFYFNKEVDEDLDE